MTAANAALTRTVANMDALFRPNAVVIVGASNDTRKYGNWIAVQALRSDLPVHLVNRTRPVVLGRRTFTSAVAVGAQIDLAVIAVPATGFEDAVDDALAAGARAIVGISGGMAESGAEGRQIEERVTAKIRAAGARLLGPNCLGVLDHTSGLTLASNEFPVGTIGLISQSGNLALELATLLADHELGVSRFASLGNQADLEAADLVDAFVEHEGTDAIALYCEDFRDGRRLARAAQRASEAGKPVVLLTVGATDASVRNAKSHTGAMVSSAIVVDAAAVPPAWSRSPHRHRWRTCFRAWCAAMCRAGRGWPCLPTAAGMPPSPATALPRSGWRWSSSPERCSPRWRPSCPGRPRSATRWTSPAAGSRTSRASRASWATSSLPPMRST